MEMRLKHGPGLLDDDDEPLLWGFYWQSQISTRQGRLIYVVGRPKPRLLKVADEIGDGDLGHKLARLMAAVEIYGTRSPVPLHRMVLGMPRITEDPRDVDHVNGNGMDNRRENLRPAKRAWNLANTGGRSGSSAFKGVSYCSQTGRWKAQITVDGQNRNLGRYDTEEEAASVYNDAARAAWGGYATLNVLSGPVAPTRKPRATSQFRGVSLDRRRQLWVAQIAVGGKHRLLGRFVTEEEAALAYNAAAIEVLGERARLNVID